LAAALLQPPAAPHGKAIAASYRVLLEDINDDENPDKWLNTGATDSLFMPSMEEPYRVRKDQNARTKTCTRLDFHGALEEMPPDAGAVDPKVNPRNIFSPNTLHKVVSGSEQLAAGGPIQKKHHRKRNKKDKSSMSQQPAGPKRSRVQDDPMSQPAKGTLQGIIHEAGKPIMTNEQVANASGEIVNLMRSILFLEEGLLKETNPSYPIFTMKVLADVGFIDDHPANIFFILYEDVFKIFKAKRLDYNLVHLYVLQRAMKDKREQNPGFAIADPYFMREGVLLNLANRSRAKEYLQKFLLDNKRKKTFFFLTFPSKYTLARRRNNLSFLSFR
jgi:hypothetical protein